MDINVKQSDCKFYVDEENRKVICVIEDTSLLFLKYIEDFKLDLSESPKFWNNLVMPHRFVGIATCSENDTFNAETGKLIAFNKAKIKLTTSLFKRARVYISRIDDVFTDIVENFNNFGERVSANTDRREERIKALLDEKEVQSE